MEWRPDGKRTGRRPKKKWLDDVEDGLRLLDGRGWKTNQTSS